MTNIKDCFQKNKVEKIGIALGGGGARGLTHIGVLSAMDKLGIKPDFVAGTSIGALIGAAYALKINASYIREIALGINWLTMAKLADMTIPKTGLIQGNRAKELVSSIIGDIKFDELQIPFACIATDIETGDEIAITKGSVVEAVRASISIPLIFSPVWLGGRFLVDGGLVNPVPVNVLKSMGAAFVIAVNPMHSVGRSIESLEETLVEETNYEEVYSPNINDIRSKYGRLLSDVNKANQQRRRPEKYNVKRSLKKTEPNIFNVIMQTVQIASYQHSKASMEGADLVIEPDVDRLGPWEFRRAREFIEKGEAAALQAFKSI